MNFYVIKSTVEETYELDKSTLSYPAQVTDLRVGIVYVLETISAAPIRIGGTEKVVKTFYVELEGGAIISIANGIDYPNADSTYTHTAAIIVPVSEVAEPAQYFADRYDVSEFALTALINGGSYEAAVAAVQA